jgi:hypothetical protein
MSDSVTVTLFEELKALVDKAEVDFVKATVKGNKAAGTRVRKVMQEVRNKAKAVRAEMMVQRKAPKPTPATPAT